MGWDDAFPEKIKYHPRRRAGGFTLIEVVIAFAVLTISFAGLFSLAAGRQKLVAASERALITRLAAQSQIERVKSLPFNALKIGSSQNFEIQLPDRNREGTLSIEQTEDPNIKLICVLVADKHTMAIERIELVTLVVARERKGP